VLRRRLISKPGPVTLPVVEKSFPAFQPMCVGVCKEKNSFSGYVELSCCLEARLKQTWLDDDNGCLATPQMVGKFECSVTRVAASVHATETKDAVCQYWIVD